MSVLVILFAAITSCLSGLTPISWWEKHPEAIYVIFDLIFLYGWSLMIAAYVPTKSRTDFKQVVLTFWVKASNQAGVEPGQVRVEIWVVRVTEIYPGSSFSPLWGQPKIMPNAKICKELRRGLKLAQSGVTNSMTKEIGKIRSRNLLQFVEVRIFPTSLPPVVERNDIHLPNSIVARFRANRRAGERVMSGVKAACVLLAPLLLLVACGGYGGPLEEIQRGVLGGNYARPLRNTMVGPDLLKLPENFTLVGMVLPREEDLVAFDPKIVSYLVVTWENGKEQWYLGLRSQRKYNGRYILTVFMPKTRAEIEGMIIGYTSMCGERLYNMLGKYEVISNPRHIHPEKHQGHLTVIRAEDTTQMVMEVSIHNPDGTETEEFKALVSEYLEFWQNFVEENMPEYGYEKYKTTLSEKEWKELSKTQLFKNDLMKLLFEDWGIQITIPYTAAMPMSAIAAKVIQLPSLLKEKMDRYGCHHYKMDAISTAKMVGYHQQRYIDPLLENLNSRLMAMEKKLGSK